MGDGGWQAKHGFIGKPPSLVAVPTHFYKVILADNKVPSSYACVRTHTHTHTHTHTYIYTHTIERKPGLHSCHEKQRQLTRALVLSSVPPGRCVCHAQSTHRLEEAPAGLYRSSGKPGKRRGAALLSQKAASGLGQLHDLQDKGTTVFQVQSRTPGTARSPRWVD